MIDQEETVIEEPEVVDLDDEGTLSPLNGAEPLDNSLVPFSGTLLPPKPLQVAELEATIATLASKRLKQLDPEKTEAEYGRYYDMYLNNQEEGIRAELLIQKMQRREAIKEDVAFQAVIKGDRQTYEDINNVDVGFDSEKEKLVLIEREASEQIIADGAEDEDVAVQQLQDAIKPVSINDLHAQILTSKLLVNREMNYFGAKLGFNMSTLGDIALTLIPFTSTVSISQKIATADNPALPGEDMESQAFAFQMMDAPEQAETLKKLREFFDKDDPSFFEMFEGSNNNLAAMAYFSHLNNFTDTSRWIENAIPFLDAAVVAGPVLKLTTVLGTQLTRALAAGDTASVATMMGNRSTAAKTTVAAVDAARSGDIAKDSPEAIKAAETLMEGTLKPSPSIVGGTPGVSERVIEDLVAVEELGNAFQGTKALNLLSPEDIMSYVPAMRQQVYDVFREMNPGLVDTIKMVDSPADVSQVTQGFGKGVSFRSFWGSKNGQGFSSVEAAQGAINEMKLDGAIITPLEVNKTFFISVERQVNNLAGFIEPYKLTGKEGITKATYAALGGLRRMFGTPTAFIDTLSAREAYTTIAVRENATAIYKKLQKFVDKVSKDEMVGLGEVMQYGKETTQWFPDDILKSRFQLNDTQIVAYNAFKKVDKINHNLLNGYAYDTKAAKGFKTIEATENVTKLGFPKNFDAVPVATITNPKNKTVYNTTLGKYEEGLTPAKIEAYKKKGYSILSLDKTEELEGVGYAQFLIGSHTDLKIKALSYKQVNNLPGGRWDYADGWFVKQARIRNREGLPSIILKSKTLRIDTKENGLEFTRKVNQALKLVRTLPVNDGKIVADELVNANIGVVSEGVFTSVDDVVELIGMKNLGTDLEIVKDGGELAAVRKAIVEGANAHPSDLDEANSIQRLIQTRGSRTSKRGPTMLNTEGREAATLHPAESASKSLERSLSMMSTKTWKERHFNKFHKTFGTVLENYNKKSPAEHFMDPIFITNPTKAEAQLIEQAQRMQAHYSSVLNTPTWGDRGLKNLMQGSADVIESSFKAVGKPLKDASLEGFRNFNPVTFLTKTTYHAFMGMFNPRQPIVQIQATALMIAANPVNGSRAAALAVPMRLMLGNENSKTLGGLARAAGMTVGMKADEVKELYDVLQKTGTWRLNAGQLVEQTEEGLSSASAFGKFLKAGEMPFLETERFNKIAATISATLDWKSANKGVKIGEEAIKDITLKTETLVAHMNNMDKASYQSGIGKAFVQFWGWQGRAMEMFIPEFMGGSKYFTAPQKLRIGLAHLVLYGVGGTISPSRGLKFREGFNEMYNEKFGENAPEAFLDAAERGLIETTLASALGVDISFANKGGLGLTTAGLGELAYKLASFDLVEIQKIDAAGLSLLTKLVPNVGAMLSLVSAKGTTSEEGIDAFLAIGSKTLRESVSSFSSYEQAYQALQTHNMMNRRGQIIDKNTSSLEALLNMVGLDVTNSNVKRAMKDYLYEDDKMSKIYGDTLSRQLRVADATGNYDTYNNLIKFYSGLYEDDTEGYTKMMARLRQNLKSDSTRLMMKYYEKTNRLINLTEE